MEGIPTTITSWGGQIRLTNAPRATLSQLNRGATLGNPGDAAQQLRVLNATLDLLAKDAPVDIIRLDEKPE
ncbi:MAG: hypothetical protein AAF490_09835 [Chloroflexota bacterium]